MNKKQKIAVVGCGNMGAAIVKGLVDSGSFGEISIYDPAVKEVAAIHPVSSLSEAVQNSEIIVLAVKPYVLPEVLQQLSALSLAKTTTVISIAAGVKLQQIAAVLPLLLVRVMPNICCTVGSGVSAIFSESEQARKIAATIFATVGEVLLAESEADIDIFTALTAGGPAFLSEVVEGLARGGEKMGLSREQALKAAIATMSGTAVLLAESGEAPLLWRDRVATPGGTTERGLAVLREGNGIELFSEAVVASAKRAREDLSAKKQ